MTDETLGKMWNILKKNDFQKDVAVKSEIICTRCKNILIKPYNVPCGCRYCHDCLISYLNGEDKFCLGESDFCKIVLISIDKNVFPDQVASIKISRIIAKCSLESCEFKTELGKMADHMRTCDRQPITCPYDTIGCGNKKIFVDKMKQHLKEENYCHVRLLMDFVDNWRNEMKLLKTNMLDLQEENKCIKEQMESNQRTILALQENVANLLKENISLKELETGKSHQNNQAIQTKVDEQNHGIKTNRKKIEDLKEKCNQIENNQEQMKTRIEELFQENESLRNELETVKLDMSKQEAILPLQMKTEEHRHTIQANIENQKFDKNCLQAEKNQEQMKITSDKMSKENDDIQTQSKQIETELTQDQANQNRGEFLWCIQNLEEKKKHARKGIEKFFYSDSFYSHRNGYKMRLGLYLGDPAHLSLGICIMQGEFDNILQWPFRHGVKLDLLNQKTGLAHVSRNLCYEDRPTNDAWKKPAGERKIGYGYQFIALSDLFSNEALSQGDQILIKATPQIKL